MDFLVGSIQLLILALLAVVVPIFALSISFYSNAINQLRDKNRIESESKIKSIKELQKKVPSEDLERLSDKLNEIKKRIKEYKKSQEKLARQISNLHPTRQIFKLFVPLLISYIYILLYPKFDTNLLYGYLLFIIILLSLIYFFAKLISTLRVITNAKKLIDDEKKSKNDKTLNLLSILSDNVQSLSKSQKVSIYISIDGNKISQLSGGVRLLINKEQKISIAIHNSEEDMAKNLEIGFRFPKEAFTFKEGGYIIFKYKDEIIIRYKVKSIQTRTRYLPSPLVITPTKQGEYEVEVFVKGENVKTKYEKVTFIITAETSGEIL